MLQHLAAATGARGGDRQRRAWSQKTMSNAAAGLDEDDEPDLMKDLEGGLGGDQPEEKRRRTFLLQSLHSVMQRPRIKQFLTELERDIQRVVIE